MQSSDYGRTQRRTLPLPGYHIDISSISFFSVPMGGVLLTSLPTGFHTFQPSRQRRCLQKSGSLDANFLLRLAYPPCSTKYPRTRHNLLPDETSCRFFDLLRWLAGCILPFLLRDVRLNALHKKNDTPAIGVILR